MTHIAIQETLDGKVVEWMKKLTASAEGFDRVNAINLRGVWNCINYELRQMREQGSGAIVNCSSTAGLVGIRNARVVDRLLVPATPEPSISCVLAGSAEFQERELDGAWVTRQLQRGTSLSPAQKFPTSCAGVRHSGKNLMLS